MAIFDLRLGAMLNPLSYLNFPVRKMIIVDASTEAAFNYLADLSRHSEWNEERYQMSTGPQGPVGGVGTVFEAKGTARAAFGIEHPISVHREITKSVPFQGLEFISEYHSEYINDRILITFDLAPAGNGTIIIMRRVELFGPKMWALFALTFPLSLPIIFILRPIVSAHREGRKIRLLKQRLDALGRV